MNPQRRQVGRRFLCVLVAALVSLLLVVLPFAQTLDASDSGRDSGRSAGGTVLQDSGAPDFEYEDADIIVTASLSGNTKIPADAELCVEPITQEKDSAAYQDVETQVNKDVTADHQTVTGFRAYDIYFSGNGTRYEPEAGDATVTIQYKDRVFDSAVKKATDEIKVLHLKKSNGKTKVENVTKAVDVKDLGGDKAKKTNSSSEAILKDNGKDGSENPDGDTVEFQTKSFSTFVVTGISTSQPATMNISLTFKKADGSTDSNVDGVYYYLYIEGSGNYHNTVKLSVKSGTATGLIQKLFDQNNDQQHPQNLAAGTYTAILFNCIDNQFSNSYPDNNLYTFRWDDYTSPTNLDCVKYEPNDVIDDNYTVNNFPNTVSVTGNSVALNIVANAKTGTSFSSSDIKTRLAPVLPYGVFTNHFYLEGSEVEGCIAANYAKICGDFGDKNNVAYYKSESTSTITVTKTYAGPKAVNFCFGLFDAKNHSVNDVNGDHIKTLTLPDGGSNSKTFTFTVIGEATNYKVVELDSKNNNKPLNEGDTDSTNTFKLTTGKMISSSIGSPFKYTSFINSFDADSTGGKLQPDYALTKLVVGDKCSVTNTNGTYSVPAGSGKVVTTISSQVIQSVKEPTAPPMPDFSGVLGTMKTLSADLTQAVLSDSVVVKNYTLDQLTFLGKKNYNFKFGNNQILLINLAVPNNSSVDLPSDLQSLHYNGVKINDTYDASNSPLATPKVIYNIYTKNGTTCSPYAGTINQTSYIGGTLLAPNAKVYNSPSAYNGRIIAAEVHSGGYEIHSCAQGTLGNAVWSFINMPYTCTPYTLPETGGGGTAIFYTTGGAVLLFGSVLAYAYRLSGKRRHIRKRRHKSPNE